MNTISKACIAGALTAAALLGAARANATGIVAYLPNQVGGTIQLTDAPCKTGDGMVALSIDSSGSPALAGCWVYLEPNAAVTWNDGTLRWYDANALTFTSYSSRYTKKPGKPARSTNM